MDLIKTNRFLQYWHVHGSCLCSYFFRFSFFLATRNNNVPINAIISIDFYISKYVICRLETNWFYWKYLHTQHRFDNITCLSHSFNTCILFCRTGGCLLSSLWQWWWYGTYSNLLILHIYKVFNYLTVPRYFEYGFLVNGTLHDLEVIILKLPIVCDSKQGRHIHAVDT